MMTCSEENSAHRVSSKTKPTSERAAPPPSDALRKAGRIAFVWVVVFIALHVYWALGGTFGFGDATETEPKVDSPAKWVFTIVVDIMFLVGAFIPLALCHEWGKRIPAWMLACCCWIGTAILVLRGFSGLLDTALRGTGLARNGLTGLTYQQELGVEHPSSYTLVVHKLDRHVLRARRRLLPHGRDRPPPVPARCALNPVTCAGDPRPRSPRATRPTPVTVLGVPR